MSWAIRDVESREVLSTHTTLGDAEDTRDSLRKRSAPPNVYITSNLEPWVEPLGGEYHGCNDCIHGKPDRCPMFQVNAACFFGTPPPVLPPLEELVESEGQ